MLEDVRKVLKLSTEALDGEIIDLINACEADLKLSGINLFDTDDPLIRRAVFTYVKANFGYEDSNDRFLRDYTVQKLALRESKLYREGVL